MEMICPGCRVKMNLLADSEAKGRRHYACPECEAEVLTPTPVSDSGAAASGVEPLVSPGSPATVPGVQISDVLGTDWQVPEELRFTLKVLEGSDAGKTFEVTTSRVTVGREEGEITLGDPLVSRKHAAFEIYGSHHIVVKDLASTNGTYLNGRLIAYSKLNHGDRVRIGTTVLEAVIEIGE